MSKSFWKIKKKKSFHYYFIILSFTMWFNFDCLFHFPIPFVRFFVASVFSLSLVYHLVCCCFFYCRRQQIQFDLFSLTPWVRSFSGVWENLVCNLSFWRASFFFVHFFYSHKSSATLIFSVIVFGSFIVKSFDVVHSIVINLIGLWEE